MAVLIDGKGLWVADTNCYVVAAAPGEPCVIIDAPPDVAGIGQLVSKHRLVPAALLATHGHVDHAGGGAVAAGYGIGAHLHPDDEFLALDPGRPDPDAVRAGDRRSGRRLPVPRPTTSRWSPGTDWSSPGWRST